MNKMKKGKYSLDGLPGLLTRYDIWLTRLITYRIDAASIFFFVRRSSDASISPGP